MPRVPVSSGIPQVTPSLTPTPTIRPPANAHASTQALMNKMTQTVGTIYKVQEKQREEEDKAVATKLNILHRKKSLEGFKSWQMGTLKGVDGKVVKGVQGFSDNNIQLAKRLPASVPKEQMEELFPDGISDRAYNMYLRKSVAQQIRLEDHAIKFDADRRLADRKGTIMADMASMSNDEVEPLKNKRPYIIREGKKLRKLGVPQNVIDREINKNIYNSVNNKIEDIISNPTSELDFDLAQKKLSENKGLVEEKYGINSVQESILAKKIEGRRQGYNKNVSQAKKATFVTDSVNTVAGLMFNSKTQGELIKETKPIARDMIYNSIQHLREDNFTLEFQGKIRDDLKKVFETTFGPRRFWSSKNHIFQLKSNEEQKENADYLRKLPIKLLKEAIVKTRKAKDLSSNENIGFDEVKEYVDDAFKKYLDSGYREHINKKLEKDNDLPLSDLEWSHYRITDKVQKASKERFYTIEYGY